MNCKILYIVVIYGVSREQSAAWKALQTCLPETEKQDIYVRDNNVQNVYLAQAYNEGVSYALSRGYSHVVLLDHDACLSKAYIHALHQALACDAKSVWVPTLLSEKGERLSPFRRWGMTVAFNSGMMLPLPVIQAFGGFNPAYPLDYLDHWVCYRLAQCRVEVRTLPVSMTHVLSVSDYSRVTEWRYKSLLEAEKRFAHEVGRVGEYKILLLCRLVKWILTRHPFVRETGEALLAHD